MEDIIQRIVDKLAEIFPETTIYTENQTSGFDVPSFYIIKTLTQSKNRFFDIQDRTVSYQIVYFANPEAPNADLNRVEELLLDNFTRLDEYSTVRNRDINTDPKEETLAMQFDLLLNMYSIPHVCGGDPIIVERKEDRSKNNCSM